MGGFGGVKTVVQGAKENVMWGGTGEGMSSQVKNEKCHLIRLVCHVELHDVGVFDPEHDSHFSIQHFRLELLVVFEDALYANLQREEDGQGSRGTPGRAGRGTSAVRGPWSSLHGVGFLQTSWSVSRSTASWHSPKAPLRLAPHRKSEPG